jgi:MFS family permease
MGLVSAQGAALQRLMLWVIVIPSFLAMGYSQPFLGGIVSYPSFYRAYPRIDTSTSVGDANRYNSLIEGVVNSTLNLGAVVGALSCMYVGNKFGRRWTVFSGSVCVIIGTVLFCASFDFAQLVIARCKLRIVRADNSNPRFRAWNGGLHCAGLAS